MKLKTLAAMALCATAFTTPALAADYGKHTFKISSGAAKDHPIATGIAAMSSLIRFSPVTPPSPR